MEKDSLIYVAGHRGMVGSAIVRVLLSEGYSNLILRSSSELDLRNQKDVENFFSTHMPEYVFLAAARVGGIAANIANPSSFLYDNLMINSNVINAAYKFGVTKLLFLGSSCIYPRLSPQPMKEEYLLDGKLEPTNEGYALSKIIGIKLCEYYSKQYGVNFISAMPPNLYGENDDFDPEKSHVVAALIRKFHEAKLEGKNEVVLWGTGAAQREFMYVDDAAYACLLLMENYSENQFINIGVGYDISIIDLAREISAIVGFKGKINFDSTKPDGMPQKLMDNSRIAAMGWSPNYDLIKGLNATYKWATKMKLL